MNLLERGFNLLLPDSAHFGVKSFEQRTTCWIYTLLSLIIGSLNTSFWKYTPLGVLYQHYEFWENSLAFLLLELPQQLDTGEYCFFFLSFFFCNIVNPLLINQRHWFFLIVFFKCFRTVLDRWRQDRTFSDSKNKLKYT